MSAQVATTTTAAPAPRGASGTAKAALALSIIALVLLIGFGIWWFFTRSGDVNNPKWGIATSATTGTSDTFSPNGEDIYIVANLTAFTLNIATPSTTSLKGAMFIVDNTTNTNAITIAKGKGVTTIIGSTTIDAKTSAQFIWLDNATIRRISPF
jgi:hypothetical protein